jgi:hypothetical protein
VTNRVTTQPRLEVLAKERTSSPLSLIREENLSDLTSDLILFAGTPVLQRLVPIRYRLRRPEVPIVGPTHSLHRTDMLLALTRMMLGGDLYPHDAIICSTRSGRAVIANMAELLAEEFQKRLKISVKLLPQLPVIPMGIYADDFQPKDKDAARQRLGLACDTPVGLYLGRFSPLNKADLLPLVLAFAHLVRKQGLKACLVLAVTIRTCASRLFYAESSYN